MTKSQEAQIKTQESRIELLQAQLKLQNTMLAASRLRNAALQAASELHDTMKAQALLGSMEMAEHVPLFLQAMAAIATEHDYAVEKKSTLTADDVESHVNACNVEVTKLNSLVSAYQS